MRCWIVVCRGRRQRRTALSAEAAGCSVDVTADVTLDSEKRAAAFAIVVAVLVFAIASRALHAQTLQRQDRQCDLQMSIARVFVQFHEGVGVPGSVPLSDFPGPAGRAGPLPWPALPHDHRTRDGLGRRHYRAEIRFVRRKLKSYRRRCCRGSSISAYGTEPISGTFRFWERCALQAR